MEQIYGNSAWDEKSQQMKAVFYILGALYILTTALCFYTVYFFIHKVKRYQNAILLLFYLFAMLMLICNFIYFLSLIYS